MQQQMKIVRTTVIEVPGLGARIKEARLRDPRPLREICASINMSPMNWYRVETEKQSLPEETLRDIEGALGVSFNVSFND